MLMLKTINKDRKADISGIEIRPSFDCRWHDFFHFRIVIDSIRMSECFSAFIRMRNDQQNITEDVTQNIQWKIKIQILFIFYFFGEKKLKKNNKSKFICIS